MWLEIHDDALTFVVLDEETFLPAPGQGAIAVEIRKGDQAIADVVRRLTHESTELAVETERAFLAAVGGGCQMPIGALAQVDQAQIALCGMIASPDGKQMIRDTLSGNLDDRLELAQSLAGRILDAGGKEIMYRLTS